MDLTPMDRRLESQNREGEQVTYLQAILSTTSDAVFEFDESGRVRGVFGQALAMYGYTVGEFLELGIPDLECLGSPERIQARTHRLRSAGFVRFETVHRRKNGEEFSCEVSVTYIKDERIYLAFVRDISLRKRAEGALLESRERFLNIIEKAAAGYFRINPEGCFEAVNRAWLQMHGFAEPSEVVGRHFSHTQVSEDLPKAEAIVRECLQGLPVPAGEFSRLRKDGSVGYHTFSLQPIHFQGQIVGLEGFLIDTTELHKARKEYETLFDTMIDGFALHEMVLNEEGEAVDYLFLRVNPAFEHLTGLSRQQIVGKPVSVVLPGIDPLWISRYAEVVKSGKSITFDQYNEQLNRHYEIVAFRPAPGQFACVFTDISHRKVTEAALQQSEEYFRAVVASMSEGVVVQDREGRIIYCNHSAEEILRSTRAEITGLSSTDRRWVTYREDGRPFPGEEHPAIVSLRTGKAVQNVVMGLDVGEERLCWISISAEPMFRNNETSPFAVTVSFSDVTSRRRVEQELRKLSSAISQSPVCVVITDLQGTIEYVNPCFAKLTGFTSEEVLGKSSSILRSGEHPRAFYADLWNTIRAGRTWKGIFHNKKKSGELFWEEAVIAPVFDATHRITNYIAVKEDITERKRAEEHMRSQAELLDVSSDSIMLLDLSRGIRYCNRSACQIYGWKPEELQGKSHDQLVHPSVAKFQALEWEKILSVGSWMGTTRHITRTGTAIDVQLRITLKRDERQEPTAILVVATDITEFKRVEQQFLRAQRLESLGSLASGVAHDLNNVLTPIMMSIDVLAPLAVAAQDRSILELLRDSASRGADIVRQLLLFGKGSDTPRSVFQLTELLQEVTRIAKETFPRNIHTELQIQKGLWPLHADRTQVHQVLLNLCVNARDAMPEGGRMILDVENVLVDELFAKYNPEAKIGPYLRISVSDSGIGIPPQNLEKIFDPFFTTKAQGQGTGLGLATVLGIVRGHAGFIQVNSALGEGTDFSVFLPAYIQQIPTIEEEVKQRHHEGANELVLVVDDEPSIRHLLLRVLPRLNYRVLAAQDGAEGIALFAQHVEEVKVVITDMMMPVMDGTQLILALRRMNPSLPIVAISGLQRPRNEFEKLDQRGFVFLQKPFTVERLAALLREVIEPARLR